MTYLEKAMAPHSSTLAWKIPWTEEPGGLQSMGFAKSWTRLSDFTFHFHALEKKMATHSSVLAWRIPGTGEPGGLPSMGSHRVGQDWSDLAAAAAMTYLVSVDYTWKHNKEAKLGHQIRTLKKSTLCTNRHQHFFKASFVKKLSSNLKKFLCLSQKYK